MVSQKVENYHILRCFEKQNDLFHRFFRLVASKHTECIIY